jgi:hypothetical protein
MILAFLASRKGYLKVMGPLIQAALDRGHRVVLLRDPGQGKPGEATTDSDFAPWPTAALVDYRPGGPLGPILEDHGAQALIGPSLYLLLVGMGRVEEARALGRRGLRLYSVDYAFETVTSDPEGYRVVDVTFYQSAFQRELHWAQPRHHAWAGDFAALRRDLDLASRCAVSGSTMLDQRALVRDPGAVRRKYGLPARAPVVLFMPPKMAVPDPWRAFVWGDSWGARLDAVRRRPAAAAALAPAIGAGLLDRLRRGNGYRRLLESVHRFCEGSGAALVVKSREKNEDPAFLRDFTPHIVERDDDVFPYTSMELMAIAELCVHFQSGAVLEAAFCGVPSLSVKVPPPYGRDNPAYEELWDANPGSFHNWDGVVWSADPPGAAALLAERKLDAFAVSPEARRAYVTRYLGFDDTCSSGRVLEIIERRAVRAD